MNVIAHRFYLQPLLFVFHFHHITITRECSGACGTDVGVVDTDGTFMFESGREHIVAAFVHAEATDAEVTFVSVAMSDRCPPFF